MADFDAPESRVEALLQNLLGAENPYGEPQSRIEAILQNMLGANNVLLPPVSRNEELLHEILEQGGGGGSDPSQGATATAADITLGKTAAANGVMITGTNDFVKPSKGVILSDYDQDGYPTKIETIGLTEIPGKYVQSSSCLFYYLNTLVLNEGVTTIGASAFDGINFAHVTLPTTITTLRGTCLSGTTADKIKIPNISPISINAYAFRGVTADELEIDGGVSLWNYATIRDFKRIVLHGVLPAISATEPLGRTDFTELFDFSTQTTIPVLAASNMLNYKPGCVIRIPAALSDTTLGEGNGWESATNWCDLPTDPTLDSYIVWEVV